VRRAPIRRRSPATTITGLGAPSANSTDRIADLPYHILVHADGGASARTIR
jgi:hypothetical protein